VIYLVDFTAFAAPTNAGNAVASALRQAPPPAAMPVGRPRALQLAGFPMNLPSRVYIALIVAAGAASLAVALHPFESAVPLKFACYVAISMFASTLKVRLPGIEGTMSVSYVMVVLGIVELSLSETTVLALVSAVVQTYWHAKSRPHTVRVIFNLASTAVGILVTYRAGHYLLPTTVGQNLLSWLAAIASIYFVVNTLTVAAIVALSERRGIFTVWRECYFWSLAYYLMGASFTAAAVKANQSISWQVLIFALPVLVIVFRSYRLYLGRLENEKIHAEEIAGLHLRTIEALALAIEAKDENTHSHLHRVQFYAVEMGKQMGLSTAESDALRAAAVLHDIGKLAVPEHIISKPGKLTPDEFEKMKIHPTVGAQILERVQFPYPVVPIVHCHHEKWDGTGYPRGLKGEEIPIGARILSAVDCLDALASDRQYRKAIPLDEAMDFVISQSGKAFDPQVVEILRYSYRVWEAAMRMTTMDRPKLQTDVKVIRGVCPDAGFEVSKERTPDGAGSSLAFLPSIAAARQEAQVLFELSQDLGSSLSLSDTLSVLDQRLRRLIHYDAMAVYLRDGDVLAAEYANGENFQMFTSLRIPLREGLSGWVADNEKSIINGNPAVEFGHLKDPKKFTILRSALAIPISGPDGNLGVVALYHKESDFFSRDHLRVLTAISSKIGQVVQNALKFRSAEISATIDGLTGLPNASSLFMWLDAELSRCRRTDSPLTLFVCDLDGFKQVNDRHGHLEGNRVLRLVAAELRNQCREYDFVARMGGDEFVIAFANERPENVRRKIVSLNRAVTQIGIEITGNPGLSMSIGEASFPENGSNAEDLLAAADHRMYDSKRRHKTRVLELVPTPVGKDLSRLISAVG
jgi:diguanylate cyclase (GGDEF)-like protein/putative nucleotidyltransferase with HDIG domain